MTAEAELLHTLPWRGCPATASSPALAGQALRLSAMLMAAAKLSVAGLTTGLAAALATTRLMSSFLYDVQPRDPAVFILCSFVALIVALLAAYIPARRATKVDPIVALRYE